MKNASRVCLTALCFAFAACQRATGTLTIVNLGEKAISGHIGKDIFTVEPHKNWTNAAAPLGKQDVQLSDTDAVSVTIMEQRTVVVEPSSAGCFVVADYRKQYGEHSTGDVQIAERFEKQRVFAPKNALAVAFDAPLPPQVPEGSSVRRLHLVDCGLLMDDQQLANSLMRLP